MAGCRIFDGTGYYSESANGADYQGLSGFTIAAWVYRAGTGTFCVPYGISNGPNNAIMLYWFSDNKIYMDVRNGSAKYRNSSANTSTGWHFLAGIFNGTDSDTSRMKVYLNGVDVTSEGTTGNPSTTSASLAVTGRVGRLDVSSVVNSSGNALAHVSIYNVALTQKEISELMFKPASPQRGRLHYWALNGNDTASNHNEADMQRVHYVTGTSMASTSASMLSPRVCLGGSSRCL
jgi:hypothetical protein